ncbi:MAG: hypothetical protein MUC72_03070 [Acidobacteria bacterium]|jgi:hypothetical protein|nr:hypothetical protein [Acidobacteriota bacterium]
MENMPGSTNATAWQGLDAATRRSGGEKSDSAQIRFRVRVSGDLCHRSGYVQNDDVKKLAFNGALSRAIRLAPGTYSLTVFVGAEFHRTNVDYAVEIITEPSVMLHAPWKIPFRARTVGITGFIVIDFTIH